MNYSDFNPLLPSQGSSQFSEFRSQQQAQPQRQQAQPQMQQQQRQQAQPQMQRQQVQRQPQMQQQRIDFNKPLLFYSKNCKFSSLFLNYLSKNKMLHNNFTCINIDPDSRTRQRNPIFYQVQMRLQKPIKTVPTMMLEGKYMLSGKEAFKWLEDILDKNSDLKGFNIFEMSQFSDMYSDIADDSDSDLMFDEATGQYIQKQSFKFLGERDQKISTPDEGFERDLSQVKGQRDNIDTLLSNQNKMSNISFKDGEMDQRYQRQMQDRTDPQIQRQQIDFTDSRFGLQGKLSGSIREAKRSEIDSKYDELFNLREAEIKQQDSGVSEAEVQQFIRSGRF